MIESDSTNRELKIARFSELSLSDPFFDSLKAAYPSTFEGWFKSKADKELYVVVDPKGRLSGMIYLKIETGPITDTDPPLPSGKWLKVGTLKIVGQGTKLGERILKKIFDTAISKNMDGIYVTVFEVHADLIALFEKYGFRRYATKKSLDGIELVLVRQMSEVTGDILKDYPLIHTAGKKVWLLAVYPEYHTQLLPDSILKNEPREIVRDVSHTNTIHKAYIGRVGLTQMTPGDIIVIYRTSDNQGPAFFRSVATSFCVVEEVFGKERFANADHFVDYARKHSVFSPAQLRNQFETSHRISIVRMTYNVAFNKRVTRGRLLEEARISEQPRWDMRELTDQQFRSIVAMSEINATLIVD